MGHYRRIGYLQLEGGGGGGGIEDWGNRGGRPPCCWGGGGGGGRQTGCWPVIAVGGGRGLGGAGTDCGGGGGGILEWGGLNCWTGGGGIIGGGIDWPGCCWCHACCPASGIGGKGTAWGGGGRRAGMAGGATPLTKGRGGTGAAMVPLAWGTLESVGGPLANKVWGLLFWALGLLAAKTLSASQENISI